MSRKDLDSEFALGENILCRDGWLMTSREQFDSAAGTLTRLPARADVIPIDMKTRYRQPATGTLDVLLLLGGLGKLCRRLESHYLESRVL